MSLQSRLASLISAIGTAIKADRTRLTAIEAMIGDRRVWTSPAVSTTTLTAYQTKITGTQVLNGGTYRVTVSFGYNSDSTTVDFIARFLINGALAHTGTELLRREATEVAGVFLTTGNDQQLGFTRIFHVTLPQGINTFLLQWATSGNGVPASIWDALVSVERVSL